MLPFSFVLEFVCLFAVVGGMLCKCDKPSIIIIITITLRLVTPAAYSLFEPAWFEARMCQQAHSYGGAFNKVTAVLSAFYYCSYSLLIVVSGARGHSPRICW